jgi:8-oxo-dGTP diphosphatase
VERQRLLKSEKMIEVTAAIIEKEGKYLIARRRGGNFDKRWEFPGGKIEKGETPEECLSRELEEELEIKVKIGNFFWESTYDYGHKKIRLIGYSCEYVSGEFALNVHDRVKWVYPIELRDYDFLEADLPFVERLSRDDDF